MKNTYLKPFLIGMLFGILSLITFNSEVLRNIFIYHNEYSYAITRSAPAVVNILITDYKDKQQNKSSASGIIVSSNGYILTNYHVIMNINDSSIINVQLRDGKSYTAKIVGYDKRTDIAVLKLSTLDKLPVIPINTENTPHLGDEVLAIGNPHNLGQTITHGIISAVGRSGSGITKMNTMDLTVGIQELIQTDAPINNGNSGGALVNKKGEFVAISTATLATQNDNTYGISFAIPQKLALNVLKEIIEKGRVIRGYLGIIAQDFSYNKGDKNISGIIITKIDPNGPSHNILQIEDIIIKINNIDVKNMKQGMEIIADSQPGTKVTFLILRNFETIEKEVTVSEQNN